MKEIHLGVKAGVTSQGTHDMVSTEGPDSILGI